jgi:hypothetical protein
VREASGSRFTSDGSMDLIVRLETRRIGGLRRTLSTLRDPYNRGSSYASKVGAQRRIVFDLLVVVVGNLVSCLRAKSESESVIPDTAFRFNSKEDWRRLFRIPKFFQ